MARSVVDIHTDRVDVERAAVLVVAGVLDVLDGGRDLHERGMRDLDPVVDLDDVLGAIATQCAVSEEESETARGEVIAVVFRDAVYDVGDAEPIIADDADVSQIASAMAESQVGTCTPLVT